MSEKEYVKSDQPFGYKLVKEETSMSNHRFIVLDIEANYPLESIRPHVYYRVSINKEEKRYARFFILNGNIYFRAAIYMSACERTENDYCCSIEKLKIYYKSQYLTIL